jgi:alpha-mannosidase
MLEFASRSSQFPGLPATRQGLEGDYFDQAAAASPDLPLWNGELYLETHRGTYTTHGEIKKANRLSELLLREAEIFGSLAGLSGETVNLSTLKPAWLNLLLLQFHDILPGSSIGEVYAEAAVDHTHIQSTGRQIRAAALAKMTGATSSQTELVVFNSLSWERSDVATVEVPGLESQVGDALEVLQSDGVVLPAQVISKSEASARVIFQLQNLPSLGYKSYSLRPAAAQAEYALQVSERGMQNRFFILELDKDGTLTRLFDRCAEREVITPGSAANQLQLFQDGPEREAAWNVHNTLDRRTYDWDGQAIITPRQMGPVCATLRIEKHFRKNVLIQNIILYDRLPRIDFPTWVQWEERQVLLKASFPLEIRHPDAAFEIQYGIVKRPTHRNTSWEQEKFEVCGHHWADLSETGYGVSLLNDCKYGYDVHGNILRLTLLRGTEFPDPEADRGTHEFTYSLLPHIGDAATADTARRAWELNVPAICVSGATPARGYPVEQSFFAVNGPAILDTIKPAEDGQGWILRLYEPYGSRGQVGVRTPVQLGQVINCDHLERNGEKLAADGTSFGFVIRPFEVKTFRIIPG